MDNEFILMARIQKIQQVIAKYGEENFYIAYTSERKQCEYIWKPVYEEYRRLGYRLKDNGSDEQ